MKVVKTNLSDCVIIEPKVFGDQRGFFLETFHTARYDQLAGISLPFVQDNHSRSSKGVLRGLHFQKRKPQGKLVRVVRGEVFDVVVDIRNTSKTFGQWEGIILSAENKKQLWVPPGFAHGFVVLSDVVDFEYKCTDTRSSKNEPSSVSSADAFLISSVAQDTRFFLPPETRSTLLISGQQRLK